MRLDQFCDGRIGYEFNGVIFVIGLEGLIDFLIVVDFNIQFTELWHDLLGSVAQRAMPGVMKKRSQVHSLRKRFLTMTFENG